MNKNGNTIRDKLIRHARVADVFTPSGPIDRVALFAGRLTQVMDVISATRQRGRHAVLYGERGVGKTSLANVLSEFLRETGMHRQSVHVNCTTNDDFRLLWKRIFRALEVPGDDVDDWERKRPDPEDVRFQLQALDTEPVIIIDELDRLDDDEALTLLADTIKTLSDHSVNVTLLLVGVADSIDELIGEHRSIERALAQIKMPRMSQDELVEIIDKGLAELDLDMTADAKKRIARLSEGLPHYTHLLSLHSAQRAIIGDASIIDESHVKAATKEAVESHSVLSEYQKAIRSPRTDTLFEQVLVACALAPKDDLGYFAARGVREPLTAIMGKPYDIPAFARHLKEFCDYQRGPVLHKEGTARRFFYRFENPLLQPFAILTGLSKGIVTDAMLLQLQSVDDASEQLPLA